jgi:hypothetical protein
MKAELDTFSRDEWWAFTDAVKQILKAEGWVCYRTYRTSGVREVRMKWWLFRHSTRETSTQERLAAVRAAVEQVRPGAQVLVYGRDDPEAQRGANLSGQQAGPAAYLRALIKK